MAEAIILRETGGLEVLQLEDVDIDAPAPDAVLTGPIERKLVNAGLI